MTKKKAKSVKATKSPKATEHHRDIAAIIVTEVITAFGAGYGVARGTAATGVFDSAETARWFFRQLVNHTATSLATKRAGLTFLRWKNRHPNLSPQSTLRAAFEHGRAAAALVGSGQPLTIRSIRDSFGPITSIHCPGAGGGPICPFKLSKG